MSGSLCLATKRPCPELELDGHARTHTHIFLFCKFFPTQSKRMNTSCAITSASRAGFSKSCAASLQRSIGEQWNTGPGGLDPPASPDGISCLGRGKGCVTSGGHYVSKILVSTRNSCISFIYSSLLPLSYVDFENFYIQTP